MRDYSEMLIESKSINCVDTLNVDNEFHKLCNILANDETIECVISCFFAQAKALFVCSNNRMISISGEKILFYDYNFLKNVKLKSGLFFSKISISSTSGPLNLENLNKKYANLFYNNLLNIINIYNSKSFHLLRTVKTPVAKFKTKIVGVTYNCDSSKMSNRQDILEYLYKDFKSWYEIFLKPYQYNFEPAIYVMHEKRDMGNLNKKLAFTLITEYPPNDYIYHSFITDVIGGPSDSNPKRNYGCNIAIYVYKK